MDARLSGFSNEEQVVTGDGGPVDWGARKGLSRAVRVDPRAEPDNQDVALWRRESRCKWKSSQFDEIEYMFPERICEDDFSPEDFTAQQIEAYVDPLPNRPSTLVIYHGDGLISPDELDGDGGASGYAIAGEFFDTLNRHAKTLEPLLSDIYRPPPMGYLAQRYVPFGKKHLNVLEPSNGKLWELKVNPKGPSEDAETKKFNVFRERPERKGAFQYMGVYSFLLDRSPTGNSLTTDQIEYLQPYERPDIIPLGQWNSAEAAHRTFQEVYGHGHHNMLFYLPRIPYFTARRHSEDHRFLRRMMQIRKEVVEY